jgi:hypothetical protein
MDGVENGRISKEQRAGALSAIHKATKKMEYHKENMCPLSIRGSCSPTLVDSHTLSIGQLELIASRGNLTELQFLTPGELERKISKGTLTFTMDSLLAERVVGKRVAGTFTGFCALHDTTFFKTIDSCDISVSKESMGLLMYRTVCRKLFIKSKLNLIVDSFDSLGDQAPLGGVMSRAYVREGNVLGEASLRALKMKFDEMMVKNEWSSIGYIVLHFSDPIDFACADSDFPQIDFAGRILQGDMTDNNIDYDRVFFGTIPQTHRGIFYISWVGQNDSSEALAESLKSLPVKPMRAIAVMRYVFSFADELFIRPNWWKALPNRDREELRMRRLGMSSRERDPSEMIQGSNTIVDYELSAIEESPKEIYIPT